MRVATAVNPIRGNQQVQKVTFFRNSVLWLGLIALDLALFWPTDASADHAFQAKTCATTPRMCQAAYSSGNPFYFRIHEYYSVGSAIKSPSQIGMAAAQPSWNNATGPQEFVDSADGRTPYANSR